MSIFGGQAHSLRLLKQKFEKILRKQNRNRKKRGKGRKKLSNE